MLLKYYTKKNSTEKWDTAIPILRYQKKKIESGALKRYLHTHAHSSLPYNRQDGEAIQVSISECIYKCGLSTQWNIIQS